MTFSKFGHYNGQSVSESSFTYAHHRCSKNGDVTGQEEVEENAVETIPPWRTPLRTQKKRAHALVEADVKKTVPKTVPTVPVGRSTIPVPPPAPQRVKEVVVIDHDEQKSESIPTPTPKSGQVDVWRIDPCGQDFTLG